MLGIAMTIFSAFLLGIIQGITEFLPISSDGHLVMFSALLDAKLEDRSALGFDILLHAGSLLALLFLYRATWQRVVIGVLKGDGAMRRLAGLLALATIPGVVAGLLFEDTIAEMRSFTIAGLGFLVTALVLILGERIGRHVRQHSDELSSQSWQRALLIGVAQACAILPGVSRSGSTISVARALGFSRGSAIDFSFLMAVPIIAGAVGKTALDAFTGAVVFPPMTTSLVGFGSSLVVSVCAIQFLRRFAAVRSLAWFAWYLIPLGITLLIVG